MTTSTPGPSLPQAQAHDLVHKRNIDKHNNVHNNNHNHFHIHGDQRRVPLRSETDPDHHHLLHHHHDDQHAHEQDQQHSHQAESHQQEEEEEQQFHHQQRQEPVAVPDVVVVDVRDTAPPYVTRVVQTVSLVQVVNGQGSAVEVQTFFAEPATVVIDPVAGVTISVSDSFDAAAASDDILDDDESGLTPDTVVPTSPANPLPEDLLGNESSESLALPDTTPSEGGAPPSQDEDSLTSIPSTETAPPASFPTIGPALNSTNPTSSDSSFLNNSSSLRILADLESSSADSSSSSTTYSSLSDPSSSGLVTTTSTISSISSTTTSTSTTRTTTISSSDDSGVGGAPIGEEGDAQSSPTPSGTRGGSSDDSQVETGTVVGGVLGGLAGLAVLLVLALFIMKYRKKKSSLALGDETGRSGGMLAGAGGPSGGDGGMVQRSLTFSSAALAGLGAKRHSQQKAPETSQTGERGFYRVSGRKLPPVLQAGGDGYTDPRDYRGSTMSDESVYYRDSQTFFDDPDPGSSAGRVALGSPMRPVSGVPVMRSGVARTPIIEENPFSDPVPPPNPPGLDPIGRSLGSADGSRHSRGSGSRFTEDIR